MKNNIVTLHNNFNFLAVVSGQTCLRYYVSANLFRFLWCVLFSPASQATAATRSVSVGYKADVFSSGSMNIVGVFWAEVITWKWLSVFIEKTMCYRLWCFRLWKTEAGALWSHVVSLQIPSAILHCLCVHERHLSTLISALVLLAPHESQNSFVCFSLRRTRLEGKSSSVWYKCRTTSFASSRLRRPGDMSVSWALVSEEIADAVNEKKKKTKILNWNLMPHRLVLKP